MATNWQPPFGGMPFPMPAPPQTPQAQQPPQHHPPNGQYQTQTGSWVPPTEEHASPWNNIPGLNSQSYNQNSQSSYPPPAWPPSLPTQQMWQQAMQMQFPMLPNASFHPPPMPYQPPPQNTTHPPPPGLSPAAQSFQPTPQLPLPVNNYHRQQQLQQHTDAMDTDKEDGEVSESDPISRSPTGNANTHPVPAPRSVPQATPRSNGTVWASHRERYTPNQPLAAQKPAETEVSKTLSQQREEAQKFVKLLHSHNIGYRSLAAENLDHNMLRDLYRALNLPSEPEPVPPPKSVSETLSMPTSSAPASSSSATSANNASTSNGTKLASVKTNIMAVPPAKSAPSPIDRKDYIARLQAAKKGKQGAAAKTASPQPTPSAASTPTPAANGQQLNAEDQKARQTRLIQERIQALKNNSSSPAPAKSEVNSKTPLTNQPSPTSLQSSSTLLVQPLPLPAKPLQPSPATPTTPFSGIPGLFMNMPGSVQAAPITPNPNKRTLSSDTRETPVAPKSADPDTMDVDSSGGHVNEREDDGTSKPSIVQLPSTYRSEQQPLSAVPISTPSRPASVKPAQSTASTPGVQTPSSRARNDELDDKQKALAAAKLQVIEKLRKQRQGKQQKEKILETPTKDTSTSQLTHSLPTPAATSHNVQQVGKSAQTHSSDAFTDDESPRNIKRLRRAKIVSDLPGLDAEMAANSAKIDELSKQLEQLIAEDKRMQQDKAKLIDELEQLGIDTEGMEHKELRATKDAIEREQAAVIRAASSEPVSLSSATPKMPQPPLSTPGSLSTLPNSLPKRPVFNEASALTNASPVNGIPGLGTTITQFPGRSAAQEALPEPHTLDKANITSEVSKASDLVEAATPMDDDEDFYSPKVAETPAVKDVAMDSPSEDGEIDMSESEEEYEPEELQEVVQQVPVQQELPKSNPQVAVEAPNTATASASSTSSSSDEELYEPPEANPTDSDARSQQADPQSGADAPLDEADDGAMDISSSDDSDSSDSDTDSTTKSPSRGVIVVNDGAQPQEIAVSNPEPSATPSEVQPDPWAYVPYDSPLRKFKSYRYHPKYTKDVPGGYLSMSYSHQIDPNVPICPTEALGSSCTDEACHNQHFRQMNISSEHLLVQLGGANPGKNPAEQAKWNDGLRVVLQGLRAQHCKDPNVVATEITKFRRQFLGDDTRVVNL